MIRKLSTFRQFSEIGKYFLKVEDNNETKSSQSDSPLMNLRITVIWTGIVVENSIDFRRNWAFRWIDDASPRSPASTRRPKPGPLPLLKIRKCLFFRHLMESSKEITLHQYFLKRTNWRKKNSLKMKIYFWTTKNRPIPEALTPCGLL